MKNLNKKTKISTISLILLLTISALIVALPSATAQVITRDSFAFIGATPNPVGVNQQVLLHVGVPQQLGTASQGWEGLSVTIVRPDGQTDTISDIRTDSTGGTGRNYVPTMVGTYQLQTHFPEQIATFGGGFFGPLYNVTLLASSSEVLELVVQEDQIAYYPGHALPDEYWTRPINAQFFEWKVVAGDWLIPAGGYTMPPIPKYHPYNFDAPETAHVLWTKPYTQGGLAGGVLGDVQYEMGDAYEGKFSGSVILSGVLYYNRFENRGNDPNLDQEVVAVDLKTGEELWTKNWNNERLAFGQAFYWDSYNYHGVFGYLWTTVGSTWNAYDPLTGRWEYTMTNVPSGWNLYGAKGEIYRYTVNLNAGWVTLWNSSRVVSNEGSWRPQGNTYDATTGIEWNKTIPTGLPGSVCTYFLNDRIFGSTSGGMGGVAETITSWAFSVSPGHEGALMFNKTWTVPTNDLTTVWTEASIEDKVFIISGKENRIYYGFSLDSGNFKWQTEPETYLATYDKWYGPAYGYGKFYTGRASGIVTCYDLASGNKLWTYNVQDKFAEILWSNNFPIEYHFLADGKIYLSYGEHSPINPTGRGAPLVCLNATTGDEIWTLSWFNNWWGGHVIIGDSIIVGMNGYDNRLYSIGKGPSAITAETSLLVVSKGTGVSIRGTVTDIAPGTQDYAIAARFPNGVPVVADEYMTDWMQYVYMQYDRPGNAVGVPVKIQIVDPAGAYAWIGTATSDAYGNYQYSFIPKLEGTYTIIVTFDGSDAYWGATTTAYLTVGPAAETLTYPGYQGPSAQDVANRVIANLPDSPTADNIADEVLNQLPEYPTAQIPDYTTMDIVILVAVAIAIVIGIVILFRKQK